MARRNAFFYLRQIAQGLMVANHWQMGLKNVIIILSRIALAHMEENLWGMVRRIASIILLQIVRRFVSMEERLRQMVLRNATAILTCQ